MKKLLFSCLLFISIGLPLSIHAQLSETTKVIMDRVMSDLKKPVKSIEKSAELNLKNIQANGSWKDIPYQDKEITRWQPFRHLVNLESLIQTYITKESPYFGNEKVFESISLAFQYWYDSDPKSSNWWHNEIATPQALGEMLIMMRYGKQQLDTKLAERIIERMKRGDIQKQTGANKTDVALHYFYRGLLTDNEELLRFATAQLFEPIQLVYHKEGLQYDYSYLQHGPQLQISSYGSVFITGVLKLANYVRGTQYALSDAKLEIFSKYYRESYLKAIRGRYIDFNVEGRGVSRPDILDKSTERNRLLVAQLLDFKNSNNWLAAIGRTEGKKVPGYQILPYHQQFWNADYVQHLRSAYTFNVRMASKRTKRSESGNKENLLGRYLSDGATNIQVNGPEYYNIMPVWEWDKIPGVTSRDYKVDRQMTQFWGEEGHNIFAGGVSDGVYGASGYVLDYDSLRAKKAWFFFDQEIVCLGAGISTNTPEPVTTTVNQCWLKGNVVSSNNQAIDKGKTAVFADNKSHWFWHDDIGYYFPESQDITLSTEIQKGNWYHINNSHTKDEVSGQVFKLWLNHGKKPQNATYNYVVLPGISNSADLKNFKAANLQVVVNTEKVQAVYHQSLKMLQAVFYEAGTLLLQGMEITCDKPCVLMVKQVNADQIWSVADPMQKESSISVKVKDINTGKIRTLAAKLPEGAFAGSTVTLQ
ncbi:chondroitinase-AC [Pedobacter rhizosphaerae]|uniref:Chondroitin AC lyase n=1 Tax=Pedobacter rhizosphaerae TaxID=390241 RepID=A0A1H9TZH6_9SPHI|nr:chondroitinase-AC [Pedobacter rhizosphaerae]SES02615.1 chondroitin AC lyase [Pedobacter rhizosphaerae]